MRMARLWIAAVCATSAMLATAADNNFPNRPIRVIIPQPAAGGADIVTRLMSTEIQKRLGQPFIVENKPGGNETIGQDAVARATPDGYTIGVISGTYSMNQTSMGMKLPFDPQKAFTPVAPMVRVPMVVLVNSDLGIKDLKSLVAQSKSNPGKFNYASAGPNTFTGVATEWLVRTMGADFTAITYGGKGILQAIAAGEIQMALGGIAATSPTVQSGRGRILAVTSAKRVPILPDVPAVAEIFPGYAVDAWYGFVAPAGTPPEVISRLNEAIGESIAALSPRLAEMGNVPMKMTPAEFQSYLSNDVKEWKRIVEIVK